MNLCELEAINGVTTCTRCRRQYPHVDVNANAVCKRGGKRGLGDATEQVLKSLGITEDRWKEAKERFGLAPSCNCRKRKEWLNKVGKYFGL